jgi:hypothetical protein
VRAVADLDHLPVLDKDQLIQTQRAAPPFGGAVAADATVRKVFASPGPLFEPQLTGTDPWRWGEALRAAGFGPDDVVLNCFSYHLSPAGSMFEEGALALGFSSLGTFLNVTLPIGGRIALPSSINTYISVVKNTSLMYVIGYPELTTTAINIANLTLETLEALTVIGIVYLALVWSLSAAIRVLEGRLALPEGR